MAANNKYSIIGRYAQGREIVAFEVANLATNAHQRYTVNQVAYLVGRGSVLNCQGQIYNGKVLFRGVGCSLDQLPTVMEKPAEGINGAEAPIKNTENISGPARRNATNDQLMGQMTLVARVKVEETSKKTLGYDFKNVGGTTGTLWRGEVLKAAREGKVTNARVNNANGKEILRSRGTTPEEQLSNLPIRIATPEELKKLGVKVEAPADKASAKNNNTSDVAKVAEIFKSIISEVMYDSDTRGLEYRPVDVNREPIPMDKIESTEFYTEEFSTLSMSTFIVIQYRSKKNGCLAELSFDFNKNDTYNNKISFAVTVAMLVKRTKGERPKNAGRFTFTLDAKTDAADVYTRIMKNIANGMNEADSSNEKKLILLSKAILANLKVAAEAELPNTDVHADSTEGENYAESTLKSYAKEIESIIGNEIILKYVINNTTMDSITFNGKVCVSYNQEGNFWLTLLNKSGRELQKTQRYEILGADEEEINKLAKTAIDELKLNQLSTEKESDANIDWEQLEQTILAVRDAAEDYLNKKFRTNTILSGYFLFTKDNKDKYSDEAIKELVEALKSGKKCIDLEYRFAKDISGESKAIGYVSMHIVKNKDGELTEKAMLHDQKHSVFQESSIYNLGGYPGLGMRITEEALDELNISTLITKSTEKLEAKLASIYDKAVKIIDEEIAKYGLKNKFNSSNEVQSYLKAKAAVMMEVTEGYEGYTDIVFNIVNTAAVDIGQISINFDMSGEHRLKLDSAYAAGTCYLPNEKTTSTNLMISETGIDVQLLTMLFRDNFDFSIFASNGTKTNNVEEKLESLYRCAVSKVNEKVANLGLAVMKISDEDRKEYTIKALAKALINNKTSSSGFTLNLINNDREDVGDIMILFDKSDDHASKLDKAYAVGVETGTYKELTKTDTVVHESSVRLISKLFDNFDFSVFASNIEEKLESLYRCAVSKVNEKVANLGLAVMKISDEDRKEYTIKALAKALINNKTSSSGFTLNLINNDREDVGDIMILFDKSDDHASKLDKAYAVGVETGTYKELTKTDTVVHESSVRLISKLFDNFDFSVFASNGTKTNNVEAFASLAAIGVNAIYGLRVPGLDFGSPVIKYSDTNGVKVLTEGNGLEKGNFPGGFDLTEDTINKACEAATNGADTVKISVTTRFYNLDFIVKNNSTFRIVYMDNSNRKSKLIATKEQAIMLNDVDAFEPVMTAAYQSALSVLMELQPLMQAAVDSGEDFE